MGTTASVDAETIWFWIGVAGMAFGAVAFLWRGLHAPEADRHHYLNSFLIVLVAATAYVAMAIGWSHITLADGHSIYYARYIDWSITTPLLLLGLATIALGGIDVDKKLVYGLMGSDVYMIATGFLGSIATDHSRWLWFTMSSGAFVAVLVMLWRPLRAKAREGDREADYVRLAAVLSGLWYVYPIIWVLGEEGVRVISSLGETAATTIVDLLAKVAYGFATLAVVKRHVPVTEAHPPLVTKTEPIEMPLGRR